jgi:hypothetical protein
MLKMNSRSKTRDMEKSPLSATPRNPKTAAGFPQGGMGAKSRGTNTRGLVKSMASGTGK